MEVLFYIVIFVIYLIIQIRAAKRKQQQQQQTGEALPPPFPGDPARPQHEVSLEDALREIRQSLGMETPSSAPPARPVEPVREIDAPSEFHAASSTFADADFENKPTAFGKLPSIHKHEQVPAHTKVPARTKVPSRTLVPTRTQIPKSELEKRASSSPARKAVQATIKAPKVSLRAESGRSAPDPDNLRDLLRDPKLARKAFVLGEVLGPPRAHRSR